MKRAVLSDAGIVWSLITLGWVMGKLVVRLAGIDGVEPSPEEIEALIEKPGGMEELMKIFKPLLVSGLITEGLAFLLGIVSFILIGCLVKVERFKHLFKVAVLVWLGDLIKVAIFGISYLWGWIFGIIPILIVMGLGGAISFLLVKPPKVKELMLIILFLTGNSTLATELTIEKAIDLALENNQRIVSFKERLKSTKAGVKEASSKLYPQINLNIASDYTKPLKEPQEAQEEKPYKSSWGISLTQILFDDEKRMGLKIAKEELKGIELDYRLLRQEVVREVAEAYYRLLMAREKEKIYREEIDRAKYLYNITEAKLKEGKVAEIDLKRVLLNLKEAEGRLKTIEMERNIAQEELKMALGLEPPCKIPESLDFKPIEFDLNRSITLALANRPEIKKEMANLEKIRLNKLMIRTRYLPKLLLSANYLHQAEAKTWKEAIENLELKEYQYQISLNLQFPIYDGGNIRSQILQQEALINSTKINIEEIKEKIIFEVKGNAIKLLEAEERIKREGENLSLARETLTIMEEKYRLGKASLADLFEVNREYTSSHLAYIQALSDYGLYRIKFYLARGEYEGS